MAAVFHDPDAGQASAEESYRIYLEYGRRLMGILDGLGVAPEPYRPEAPAG